MAKRSAKRKNRAARLRAKVIEAASISLTRRALTGYISLREDGLGVYRYCGDAKGKVGFIGWHRNPERALLRVPEELPSKLVTRLLSENWLPEKPGHPLEILARL